MSPIKYALTIMLLAAATAATRLLAADATNARPITVVSYYFGNYHPGDPRNVKTKGADCSEWELVKNAKPRFPGHQQPHVPLWGYQDESDPLVMAKKINAAADHGISAFIFDRYYGYPFMNTMKDNTPENFHAALELARQRLLAETNGLRILNLNCWNEWTEGSYLEPDTVHDLAYLDAVKAVFSNAK